MNRPVIEHEEPEPLPPASAWAINRHFEESLNEVKHTIHLPLANGADFSWVVCRADKLLQYFAGAAGASKQVLRGALEVMCPLQSMWGGRGA